MSSVNNTDWETLLDQLSAATSNSVYYLRESRTRLRLVLQEEQEPKHFFEETLKNYQGQISSAYLIFAIVLQTSSNKDNGRFTNNRVMAVRIPKTALRSIIGQLKEGWDLFDPNQGHAVTISKTKNGSGTTTYEAAVTPKPYPIDLETLEWPTDEDGEEMTLSQIAEIESKRQTQRASQSPTSNRNQPVQLGDGEEDDIPF